MLAKVQEPKNKHLLKGRGKEGDERVSTWLAKQEFKVMDLPGYRFD